MAQVRRDEDLLGETVGAGGGQEEEKKNSRFILESARTRLGGDGVWQLRDGRAEPDCTRPVGPAGGGRGEGAPVGGGGGAPSLGLLWGIAVTATGAIFRPMMDVLLLHVIIMLDIY